MARILFIVPPLTGHINPTVSVGQILKKRGHRVAWVGHAGKLEKLLHEGSELLALDDPMSAEDLQKLTDRSNQVRGLEGMKFLWQEFLIPLARSMRQGVEAAVRRFKPDVLVTDQQALAGAIVGRKMGFRFVTFTTSSAGLVETPLPKVWNWVLNQLADLQREAGLPVVRRPDISDDCMIVFTVKDLVGDLEYPVHYHLVGPSISERQEDVAFPWKELKKGPRLLVSLGTVNAERGGRFYQKLLEVMADQPVQIILAAPRNTIEPVPDNFIVQEYLPQLALLAHVNAVVCHAGQNTVSETLAHGLPLVVCPIKDDQGLVATQVVQAGAAVRVRFGRLTAKDLEAAIWKVLKDDSYRLAAKKIQQSFQAAGGAEKAADIVEGMA